MSDDDDEKDWLFVVLETANDKSPRNYIKIVLGDFNDRWARKLSIFPQLAITVFTVSQTTTDPG
jgi:hypothetical protein